MKSKDQEDKELAEAIGKRITELRKANLLSQVTLAERVGIRQAPLSNIEQGKCLPSTPVLIGLAQALGASVDEILGMNTETMQSRANEPVVHICGDETGVGVATAAIAHLGGHPVVPMGFELTSASSEDVANSLRRALGIEHAIHLDLCRHLQWEGIDVVESEIETPFAVFTNSDATKAVIILRSSLSDAEKQFSAAQGLARLAIALRDILMHEKIETLQSAKERVATSIALAFLLPNMLISRYISRYGTLNEARQIEMASYFNVTLDRLKQRLTLLGLS